MAHRYHSSGDICGTIPLWVRDLEWNGSAVVANVMVYILDKEYLVLIMMKMHFQGKQKAFYSAIGC